MSFMKKIQKQNSTKLFWYPTLTIFNYDIFHFIGHIFFEIIPLFIIDNLFNTNKLHKLMKISRYIYTSKGFKIGTTIDCEFIANNIDGVYNA